MNLRSLLSLVFGVRVPVTRAEYIATGLVLAVFKYAVEVGVIRALTGNWLTPFDFLNPSLTARQAALAGGPEWLGWVLFAWNLPFIWIALSMSVRRAAVANASPWVGLGVLVPVAGLFVILCLAIYEDVSLDNWQAPTGHDMPPASLEARAVLPAVGAALGVGIVMLVLCVYLLQSYGAALFLATPLVMGTVAGFLFNQPSARSLASTVGLATLVLLAAALVLLTFALGGLICIAMAAPIAAPLGILGAILGRAARGRPRSCRSCSRCHWSPGPSGWRARRRPSTACAPASRLMLRPRPSGPTSCRFPTCRSRPTGSSVAGSPAGLLDPVERTRDPHDPSALARTRQAARRDPLTTGPARVTPAGRPTSGTRAVAGGRAARRA